jgi:hypothetical protein
MKVPNNESKASWMIKQKAEHPESARLKVSLRYETHHPGYSAFIESIEAKIDSGRGYKGRHEETGRKPGTRILSRMVWDADAGCNVEEFYIG